MTSWPTDIVDLGFVRTMHNADGDIAEAIAEARSALDAICSVDLMVVKPRERTALIRKAAQCKAILALARDDVRAEIVRQSTYRTLMPDECLDVIMEVAPGAIAIRLV